MYELVANFQPSPRTEVRVVGKVLYVEIVQGGG